MSISCLVTGALFRDPETRSSKNNKPYIAALLTFKDGDALIFVNLVCFNAAAQDALLLLRAGDSCSVQGAGQIRAYSLRNGEPRASLSIVVDQLLPLRAAPPKHGGSYYPPEPDAPKEASRPGVHDDLIPQF